MKQKKNYFAPSFSAVECGSDVLNVSGGDVLVPDGGSWNEFGKYTPEK